MITIEGYDAFAGNIYFATIKQYPFELANGAPPMLLGLFAVNLGNDSGERNWSDAAIIEKGRRGARALLWRSERSSRALLPSCRYQRRTKPGMMPRDHGHEKPSVSH